MVNGNDVFEKNWTPKVKDVRENTYTNSKGEEKHQCFITIDARDKHTSAAIFPYSKDEMLSKFKNEMYPDSLNIPIKKDHQFHVVLGNGDKREYKDVDGSELRRMIDYYVVINLKDARIAPLQSDENVVRIQKNNISVIVPKDWIKEGPYGNFISVRHNADQSYTTPKREKVDNKYEYVLNEEGKRVYEKHDVSWAYIKKIFDRKPRGRESQDLASKMKDAAEKSEANNNPSNSYREEELTK